MIIQNYTIVISPGSSPASSSSPHSSSHSSTDSDWLEVKMETDESPDPNHSQPESSPEISPQGTPYTQTATTTLILSPPAAFADLSSSCSPCSQSSQGDHHFHSPSRSSQPSQGDHHFHSPSGTQPHQQRTPDTASKLRTRAGGSPLTPHNRRRRRTQHRSGGAVPTARTNDLSSPSSFSRAAGSPGTTPVLEATDSLLPPSPPVWNVTEPGGEDAGESSSPSIMATASMMNSTYAIRTPGSCSLFHTFRQSPARRTPTIVLTDSAVGTSPLAAAASTAANAVFLQSAFAPAVANSNRTPHVTATDSLIGKSSFSVRSPSASSSAAKSPSLPSRTPCVGAAHSVVKGNPPVSDLWPSSTASCSTAQSPFSSFTSAAARTPALTPSTGNHPFGLGRHSPSSCSAAAQPPFSSSASGGAARHWDGTPVILASSSVMGNSTMSSPAPMQTSGTPSILSSTSLVGSSPMMTPPSPTALQPDRASCVPLPCPTGAATTTLTNAQTTGDCAARGEAGEWEGMEVTMATGSEPCEERPTRVPVGHRVTDCGRNHVDSFRNHHGKLNEELQVIKGQFFNLLDDLGFSHDIYYKQTDKTSADSPRQFQYQTTPAVPISQSVHDLHASVINATTASGMSTPRSRTPRSSRLRAPDTMRSMYADLLIDQLLAQAQTDSSDTSNSPPEPDNASGESNLVEAAATIPSDSDQENILSCNIQAAPSCSCPGIDHAVSVNINRGDEDTPTKGSTRSKDIPAFGNSEVNGNLCASPDPVILLRAVGDRRVLRSAVGDPAQFQIHVSSAEDTQEGEHTTLVSQAVSTSANESGSSAPTTSTSSSSRSVPDLDKELVSRIQYYSDFTIDRQKKIDEAVEIPEAVESPPPTVVSTQNSNDISNESISHRCVEGSETPTHPGLVPVFSGRPQRASSRAIQRTVPSQTSVSSQIRSHSDEDSSRYSCQAGKPQHQQHSSDLCESDTSSGTGSMPRSQHSSSRHSSRHTSSSRDRADRHRNRVQYSSAERRSSSSSSRGSRASRCSSHPLASSTLISDPSSNSGSLKSTGSYTKSGSVYTWSLENSSDENLHASYLRSSEKQHRRSRKSRHQRSMAKSSHSRHHHHHHPSSQPTRRPATLIGADSPPDQCGPDGGASSATLHLTHMVSMIDNDSSPARRFGGCSFENGALPPTPRSSSLPRTSTRIGGLLFAENVSNSSPHKKASSFPELSSNPWMLTGHPSQDLNCAISRIGPSNLSSGLQGMSDNRSGSGQSESGRPAVAGKSSSTSESAASFYSQCFTCNPTPSHSLLSPAASASRKLTVDLTDQDEILDEILTNSPRSYDSSGLHAPYNSYTSPAGSTANDYTTVSDSSSEVSAAERDTTLTAVLPNRPDFAVKTSISGVFKIPFAPAARSIRRGKVGGHPTHNVGVRAVGTGAPHVPLGLVRHKEPASRRKLFSIAAPTVQAQPSGHFLRAPKITDRKALVRKFKKFSTHFKKDKDSAKIHTLATL